MKAHSLQQFFEIAGVSVSTQSHSASFQSFRSSLSAVIPIQRRRIEILDRSDFEMCRARFFLSPFRFFPLCTYVQLESYRENVNTMHGSDLMKMDAIPKREPFKGMSFFNHIVESMKLND